MVDANENVYKNYCLVYIFVNFLIFLKKKKVV